MRSESHPETPHVFGSLAFRITSGTSLPAIAARPTNYRPVAGIPYHVVTAARYRRLQYPVRSHSLTKHRVRSGDAERFDPEHQPLEVRGGDGSCWQWCSPSWMVHYLMIDREAPYRHRLRYRARPFPLLRQNGFTPVASPATSFSHHLKT
jgi:hypothetical protein